MKKRKYAVLGLSGVGWEMACTKRVAQTACKMVIEPLFKADFDKSSYGFRSKRAAKGAIREIMSN